MNYISFLLKHAHDARFDIVARAMRIMQEGFRKQINEEAAMPLNHVFMSEEAKQDIASWPTTEEFKRIPPAHTNHLFLNPEQLQDVWELGQKELTKQEAVKQEPEVVGDLVCADCGGSGEYVGLMVREQCGGCGGTGRLKNQEARKHQGPVKLIDSFCIHRDDVRHRRFDILTAHLEQAVTAVAYELKCHEYDARKKIYETAKTQTGLSIGYIWALFPNDSKGSHYHFKIFLNPDQSIRLEVT